MILQICFNTSHVVVYLFSLGLIIFCSWVSIHLMLQFIPYLSYLNWFIPSFNTSHVVVYRHQTERKYFVKQVSIHLMLQFIYFPLCPIMKQGSFNTSHVVVYLIQEINGRRRSEVSIHLMLQFILSLFYNFYKIFFVSIHLMLQFITEAQRKAVYRYEFQYISCCSLSQTLLLLSGLVSGFNTSHVVVYLRLI